MSQQDSDRNEILLYSLLLLSLINVVNPFLVVPPTSPTRHQLISGIGIPLQLENEAITLGLVFKAMYFLVSWLWFTVSVLIPTTFNSLRHQISSNSTSFPASGEITRKISFGTLCNILFQTAVVDVKSKLIHLLTGQTYESYDGDVVQTGDVPLRNETVSNVDDEFDDQFEEDIEEQKRIEEFFRQHENGVEDDTDKTDDPDLSSSRWIAYDALAQMLQRWKFTRE